MEDTCLQAVISYLLTKIQGMYEELYKQLKKAVVKGEVSSRKLDQKEASAAVLSFYHNVHSFPPSHIVHERDETPRDSAIHLPARGLPTP